MNTNFKILAIYRNYFELSLKAAKPAHRILNVEGNEMVSFKCNDLSLEIKPTSGC